MLILIMLNITFTILQYNKPKNSVNLILEIYSPFKKDEFAEGLIELQDRTFKEISAMVNGEESTVPEEEEVDWGFWVWLIIIILIIVFNSTDGFGTGIYIPIITGGSSSSGSSGSSGFGGGSSGGGASRHF